MPIALRFAVPIDAEEIAQLFTTTVHSINRMHYSQQQLDAWAPRPYNLQHWQQRVAQKQPLVAEYERQIVGFGELESDGHIDAFYVHAEYQGRGVGKLLLTALEAKAHANCRSRLYAEVSSTALPFFQHHGFQVIAEQSVIVRAVRMTHYRMAKHLI